MINRDDWNPITEEMRKYYDKHKDFPALDCDVWITHKNDVLIAHLEIDSYDPRLGWKYAWYGLGKGRIASIHDDSVKAWRYIDIPRPYEEWVSYADNIGGE